LHLGFDFFRVAVEDDIVQNGAVKNLFHLMDDCQLCTPLG
jgi:hypothetical protein